MNAGFILKRQYIDLQILYNHFHAFFTSPLRLIVKEALYLSWLTEFWICQCCVIDNYLSVNFPTQIFLLLCCLWWFKAFSTFPIFHETHIPALQYMDLEIQFWSVNYMLVVRICKTRHVGSVVPGKRSRYQVLKPIKCFESKFYF